MVNAAQGYVRNPRNRWVILLGLIGILSGILLAILLFAMQASPTHAIGPNAIRAGFDSNTLPATIDGSTGLEPIGFTINFFGTERSSLFVNNNGNVTFDAALSTFNPFVLSTAGVVLIAPFFADMNTNRGVGNVVTFGTGDVGGRPAFGAN